jgi:SAM-dependent methyltransferase
MGFLYNLYRATEEENRRVILRMLEPRAEARLLDLGCFDGDWSTTLAREVGTTDITGVEVVPEVAEKARCRGIKVVSADLNGPLPLPDASFDIVHANQVIEHLHGTDQFVSEVKRVLAPGGYAILSTNNLASFHNIASLILGRQPPPCHVSNRVVVGNPLNPMEGSVHEFAAMAHLRIFSYRALREFLGVYGLKPDWYRTVGFYPFPLSAARVLTRVLPIYGAFLTCRVRHA